MTHRALYVYSVQYGDAQDPLKHDGGIVCTTRSSTTQLLRNKAEF